MTRGVVCKGAAAMALLALLLLEASVNAEPVAARRLLGGADGGARQRAPPPQPLQVSESKPASCRTFNPHNPPFPPSPNMP
jgi:hypothetical protein